MRQRFFLQNLQLRVDTFARFDFCGDNAFCIELKGALNPNFLNLTLNRENLWL